MVEKFPFRIATIRTDNGHEFRAKFHWHVEDLGMSHHYVKPRTPRLNGKVERSHLTDEQEFYQLLEYKDDVDLNKKLAEWESFYNLSRPHGGFAGKTPYEVLKDKDATTGAGRRLRRSRASRSKRERGRYSLRWLSSLKAHPLEEDQLVGYSQSANRPVEVGQNRRLSAEVMFITGHQACYAGRM